MPILKYLLVTLLCFTLAGCKNDIETPQNVGFKYKSFEDVPGVTTDEIKAIEKIRKETTSFVFGSNPGTEAFYDEYGKINGFTILLCKMLTEMFDIPFMPKIYEWNELVAGLENGEISFSGELTATEERRKTYFMTDPIAFRSMKTFRLAGSTPINEIAQTRPLRYAFLEGTTAQQYVKAITEKPFESFFVGDYETVYKMLKDLEIDAFLDESPAEEVFDTYTDIDVEYFYPLIYTEVSLTTQNPALAPIISVFQKILKNGGDRYLAELYNVGQRHYVKNKLSLVLNDDEKRYIREKSAVALVAEYDNYPTSFYNAQENEWQGIAFDVLKEIEELTGLSFKIINEEDTKWPVLLSRLERGDANMITELIRVPEREDHFLWTNNSILTDYYALISKSHFKNVNINEILYMNVGLVHGNASANLFRKWFPNHQNTKEYESSDMAFSALENGEVDIVMSNRNQLLYLTNFRELVDYKINLLFDLPFESTFGFYSGDTILCRIVDKTLRLIDTKSISDNWTRKVYDYSTKLAHAKTPLMLSAGILLLCVLVLVTVMLIRNRNEGKRLELEVHTQTTELKKSHQALEAAVKTAEAANRAKSAFLTNMSHEIRTPMNNIISLSEFTATDDNLSSSAKENIGKIIDSSKLLLQIINDVLDISKIESGKMELENVPFDLHEIFANCRTATMPKAIEKGIELNIYSEPVLEKKLMGDPAKLSQIFMNLILNAIKFTEKGSVELSSSIEHIGESSCLMRFAVKDTGVGMTPEQVGKIFEPFAHADSDATKIYGGSGLGLSITKSFIEMMGSNLLVESALGVGSKFAFELNFKIIDATINAHHIHYLAGETEKPFFEGDILVCEDNKMNQKVISSHLAKIGLQVVLAENGKEGVEIAKGRFTSGNPFKLIFMDIHMPVMDGLEATEKIIEFDKKTPIVALTANLSPEDKENYEKHGISDHLGKPFTSQELWNCLMKYIAPVKAKG